MALGLSSAQVANYEKDGFLFPIAAIDSAEIAARFRSLQEMENARAGRLPPLLNFKAHLLVPWLWDMICDPRIVDPVESLLGGDILCWESSFFSKSPGDPSHVTWHQDATYWGLSENEGVTAWLAFTPSLRANGCMRVLSGSHRRQVLHINTGDRSNMLPIGEKVAVAIDEGEAVDVVLQPGEMSLHHPILVHGSEPNSSGSRRVGFAIRYIPGRVRQRGQVRGSATLVRGRDLGQFDLEQPPESDFDPAARARHSVLLRRWMKIVSAQVSASP